MGNTQSGMVYRKLSKELPPVKVMGYDEAYGYCDVGMKVFTDEKDREQFIYAVITVATSNGLSNFNDHDFKLLYTRRESDNERIVARILAIKDGVIRAKIEPDVDGADQKEAFKALRKDIEVKLDKILQTIPDRQDAGGSATPGAVGSDAPPAYSSPNVRIVGAKDVK